MKKKIDRGTLTGKIEKITSLKIRAVQISSQSTNASLLWTSSKIRKLKFPFQSRLSIHLGLLLFFLPMNGEYIF